MATTTEHLFRSGLAKLPDFDHDFTDMRTFVVGITVDAATVAAGNFTLTTTATIDTSGEDGWPTAGSFCINGRVFFYTGITGMTFTGVTGGFGDIAADLAITSGEIGRQTPPASILNALIACARPAMVYRTKAQTGLTGTIAPFLMFDGTDELSYAGGSLVLSGTATHYVAAWNDGGVVTIIHDTTDWATLQASVGQPIRPLAKVTTDGSAWTNVVDERYSMMLLLPGMSAGVSDHGALSGLSDDDHTQYALLAGRTGGQTMYGGDDLGDDLTLESTSAATKGSIFFGSVGTGRWEYDSTGYFKNYGAAGVGTGRIGLRVSGDAADRFALAAGGGMGWGDGTNPQDLFLERGAAGRLDLAATNTFRLLGDSTTPAGGAAGEISYNTTVNLLAYHNGSGWIEIPAPFGWTEVTGTSASMAVENGYIANNAALVTLTLPATAAVGKRVRVIGSGAGGWKIAQNASQVIRSNDGATTVGTGGHLDSTGRYDCVELICIVANTDWVIASITGSPTLN